MSVVTRTVLVMSQTSPSAAEPQQDPLWLEPAGAVSGKTRDDALPLAEVTFVFSTWKPPAVPRRTVVSPRSGR